MNDPRLDRVPELDERSRMYPLLTALSDQQREITIPPSRSWYMPITLDQGQQGACVGFGWSYELAGYPVRIYGVDNAFAREIYTTARRDYDEWPGEDYSGTSVLAGAKAVTARGYLLDYLWGFSLDDLVRALAYKGPVVVGVNWYTGMFEPESDGRIRPTGQIEGGHCIVARQVRTPSFWVTAQRRRIGLRNSWGPNWGPLGPDCYMTWDDMERLLNEGGEACLPGTRLRPAV